MKAVWTGSISFGLVNIPVHLYSAVKKQTLGFRLLHKKNKTPIQYKRWCPKCKTEVDWEDVVKGLEISRGEYFVLTKEEIGKLKPENTDTVDIMQFVEYNQIDPIYFDKHYFIGPAKQKEKTYFLFREVLQSTAKAAVGKFVMREKEYTAMIASYKNGLLLTTLNYAYEIRDIHEIEELEEAPKLRKQEIDLANELVDKLYEEEFDMARFKDTFAEELKKTLRKGEKVVTSKGKEKKTEKNLVKALQASLK